MFCTSQFCCDLKPSNFLSLGCLWLSSFYPSDLVIVVWRQTILTRRLPVPLLLAHTLRPETTPSGTAAAISQSPFLSPFFHVTHKLFIFFLYNLIPSKSFSVQHQVPKSNSGSHKNVCLVEGYLRRVVSVRGSWPHPAEGLSCYLSVGDVVQVVTVETYSTFSNGTQPGMSVHHWNIMYQLIAYSSCFHFLFTVCFWCVVCRASISSLIILCDLLMTPNF